MKKKSLFSRYTIIVEKVDHHEGCVNRLFIDLFLGPNYTFNLFIKLSKYFQDTVRDEPECYQI